MSMQHEVRSIWSRYQDSSELLKELLLALDQRDATTFQYFLQQPDLDHNCVARCFEYICNQSDCGNYVRLLLNVEINPNQITVFGKKPIHLAAEFGNATVLDILLNDRRIDVNSEDIRGWTALHYVVKQNVVCQQDVDKVRRCMRVLLKHSLININKRCTNVYDTGATALHLAAGAGKDVALAALLRDKRTNINVVDEAGKTALHYASAQNDRDPKHSQVIHSNITLLLGRADIDVNKRDSTGRTPMHLASQANNYTAFEVLLRDPRIDTNAVDGYGRTVLHYEAGKSDKKLSRRIKIERILTLLLDSRRGTDINKVDGEGKTATHEAAERGNLVAWKVLLMDKRTDVNIRDCNGRTVLHCIAERHDADPDRLEHMNHCISLLLDGPELQNTTMSTVVSRDEFCRYRLDIDATDECGETALHKAAQARNQHLILTLLRHGASLRLKSSECSPLDGIATSTLETFLDECIQDNKHSLHSADYALIFNYRFLSENKNKPETAEIEPLLYMSQSKNLRHLLKHPVISTFIDLKWRHVQVFYYINIILYTLFLIFLNWYIIYTTYNQDSECRHNDTPAFIVLPLFCLLLYVSLREMFEMLVYPWNYIKSMENYIEIILILITFVTLLYENSWQDCQGMRILFVVSLVLSWFEWVLLTGRLPFLSIQVEMLKTVSVSFLTFMAWYSFMIIAFAIIFYILFYVPSSVVTNDDSDTTNSFQNIALSLFRTIIMMAGEFGSDSLKFDSAANIASHLVFVFFVVLIALVMLNLLNGLAVSDTHAITKQAQILSQVSRVKSTFYIETTTLIDPNSYNFVSKRILCCFPFVNLSKIYNRISLFASISHEMKVFIFPNRKRCISFTRPFKNGRHGVLQNKFVKLWHWSHVHLDTKTIKSALDILTRQQILFDDPLKDMIGKLQNTMEENKQRLDEIEARLTDTIHRMMSLIENRRFQTDA